MSSQQQPEAHCYEISESAVISFTYPIFIFDVDICSLVSEVAHQVTPAPSSCQMQGSFLMETKKYIFTTSMKLKYQPHIHSHLEFKWLYGNSLKEAFVAMEYSWIRVSYSIFFSRGERLCAGKLISCGHIGRSLLGGSVGMLPQKNFEIWSPLRVIWGLLQTRTLFVKDI